MWDNTLEDQKETSETIILDSILGHPNSEYELMTDRELTILLIKKVDTLEETVKNFIQNKISSNVSQNIYQPSQPLHRSSPRTSINQPARQQEIAPTTSIPQISHSHKFRIHRFSHISTINIIINNNRITDNNHTNNIESAREEEERRERVRPIC